MVYGAVSRMFGQRTFKAGQAPAFSKLQDLLEDATTMADSPRAAAELAFLFRYMMPAPVRAGVSLAGSAGRQIGYGSNVAFGAVEPTDAADAVRGAITGKPSPDSRVRQ